MCTKDVGRGKEVSIFLSLFSEIRFSLIFIILFFGMVHSSASILRPNLYLDGEALADQFSAQILQKYENAERLLLDHLWDYEDDGVIFHLYQGKTFYPPSHEKRRELKAWILAQTDSSISPLELYQEALNIESGVLVRALVLVWDVLVEGWSEIEKRNSYAHSEKLIDITGEKSLFKGNVFMVPLCGYCSLCICRHIVKLHAKVTRVFQVRD
jgi:hypothetical protein